LVTFGSSAADGADNEVITPHLYRSVGDQWTEISSVASEDADYVGAGSRWFSFTPQGSVDLAAGDYRMRFAQNGEWVAVSDYRVSGQADGRTQSCFIPITLGTRDQKSVAAGFDSDDSPLDCSDEPDSTPDDGSEGNTTDSSTGLDAASAATAATPTAVPTSTPAPVPSATTPATVLPAAAATDEPTATPGVDSDVSPISMDVAWLHWTIDGVVLAAILSALGVMVVRRQR
jgi:hypothetical protein